MLINSVFGETTAINPRNVDKHDDENLKMKLTLITFCIVTIVLISILKISGVLITTVLLFPPQLLMSNRSNLYDVNNNKNNMGNNNDNNSINNPNILSAASSIIKNKHTDDINTT